MIKESEIVTKKYLAKELKDVRGEIVALGGVLRLEMKEQKYDIIREVRSMMHETMESSMENMKVHYDVETKRHMSILTEGLKEELQAYKDGVKMFMDKMNDHESRITTLETSAV